MNLISFHSKIEFTFLINDSVFNKEKCFDIIVKYEILMLNDIAVKNL